MAKNSEAIMVAQLLQANSEGWRHTFDSSPDDMIYCLLRLGFNGNGGFGCLGLLLLLGRRLLGGSLLLGRGCLFDYLLLLLVGGGLCLLGGCLFGRSLLLGSCLLGSRCLGLQ